MLNQPEFLEPERVVILHHTTGSGGGQPIVQASSPNTTQAMSPFPACPLSVHLLDLTLAVFHLIKPMNHHLTPAHGLQ